MSNMQNGTAEFVQMDPRELVIGANARIDVKIDPELVASIAERGVLQAITATRDEQGRVLVVMGQRRTLAAVEAGRSSVPVMIVEAETDDIERIVSQVEENDRRADMSATDRVAVAEQLALMGLSTSQIAKRTRRETAEVEAALSVAGNATVRERLAASPELDLAAAAALAEFHDDAAALEQLERAIEFNAGQITHTLSRLRLARDEAEAVARYIETARAAGQQAMVVEDTTDADLPVRRLLTTDGQKVDADDHATTCPGHVLLVSITGFGDNRRVNGEPGCRNYASHGHRDSWNAARNTTKCNAEERRAVIAGNRAWRAATEVRSQWLRQFVKATKLPTGGEKFTAQAVARGHIRGAEGLAEVTGKTQNAARDSIAKMGPARAAVATLAMCLADYEHTAAQVQTWRTPGPNTAHYLRTIAGWGYTLSDAETTFCETTEKKYTAQQ